MLFKIIYIDPPWSYNRKVGQGVIKDYNSMANEDIYKLPISRLADDDCALICWLTFPKIAEGVKAIQSWGFEIKTVFATWIKLNSKNMQPFFGVGSYTKSNCEFCLLATKGNMHKYVKTNSISSVVMAPREKHSKKPDVVRKMITDLFGELPRVELFARQRHDGWTCLGDELSGKDIRTEIEELICTK